ncbi:MAG: hypothetical protein L3J09_04825 [Flavobacteriaceae bacterium]|nr:hypothetical protein [Flavobacteriaceae bacterium]
MSLLKRFAFYFGGFGIGLVLLYFFIGGSGASCEYDYGPGARTKKNIRLKERVISENSLRFLKNNQLDTSAISYLLKKGSVLFSESNTELDSCKVYVIEGNSASKENSDSIKKLKIKVENCNSIATIREVFFSE